MVQGQLTQYLLALFLHFVTIRGQDKAAGIERLIKVLIFSMEYMVRYMVVPDAQVHGLEKASRCVHVLDVCGYRALQDMPSSNLQPNHLERQICFAPARPSCQAPAAEAKTICACQAKPSLHPRDIVRDGIHSVSFVYCMCVVILETLQY